MTKRTILAIVSIAIAGMTTPASAADSNFYGVASVGRSTIGVDPNSVNNFTAANGTGGTVTSAMSNDVGFKAQLGYQFTRMFSLEGGYTNLGTAQFVHTNPVYTAIGNKKADLFNLDMVGKFDLDPAVCIAGQTWLYRWETKSNMPTPAGMTGVTEDGFDWKFGAGGQYAFTERFAVRGEF